MNLILQKMQENTSGFMGLAVRSAMFFVMDDIAEQGAAQTAP